MRFPSGEREREEKRERAVTIATSHLMVLMLLRRHKTPSSRDTLTNTAYYGKFVPDIRLAGGKVVFQ